jgi:hypothetical protein
MSPPPIRAYPWWMAYALARARGASMTAAARAATYFPTSRASLHRLAWRCERSPGARRILDGVACRVARYLEDVENSRLLGREIPQ